MKLVPLCTFIGLALVGHTPLPAAEDSTRVAPKRSVAADAFFSDSAVRIFELSLPEAAISQLARSPRSYVAGELKEGDIVLANVGVRLKGNGSFRGIDLKPSFALKFDEFVEGQSYRGFKKLMFNNSAQDRTYLSELLATELFRDAGLPAARVTHAKMRLNGRDLGLYVVIEAMNKDFLKRQFGDGKGNLYEAYLQDVNGQLEQDSGDDSSRADLRALCDACTIVSPKARWEQLNKVLDVERFVAFLAMEMLTSHWDGYAVHINNYRIYHDPATDKMVFITHGLDWAFRRPTVSIQAPQKTLVGSAVLTTPEGRKLFEQQISKLATEVFKVPAILQRIDKALEKIRGAGLEPMELARIERRAAIMRERIEQRGICVNEQLRGVKPETVKFDALGVGTPVTWRDEPDRGEPVIDRVEYDGKKTLHIRALQEPTHASWRSQVFLQPGSYRLEGLACAESVAGGSARLRVSGGYASSGITGTSPWRPLQHVFSVGGEGMDVELVCELSSQQGDAWFDVDSLRVKRIGPAEGAETRRQPAVRRVPVR